MRGERMSVACRSGVCFFNNPCHICVYADVTREYYDVVFLFLKFAYLFECAFELTPETFDGRNVHSL